MSAFQTQRIIKAFRIFVFTLIVASFGSSCSKKAAPSGLEGNLLGNKTSFSQSPKQRERQAKRARRQTAKLEEKANKKSQQAKIEAEKTRQRLAKAQIDKQHPDVQKRMKANQKKTETEYRNRKPAKRRFLFWK